MKDQDYKRYTVNMNGEIQATEFLKVGMGINASHSIKNYGIVSNFSNTTAKDSYGLATSLMPYAPAFDENGKILSPDDGPSRHNVLLNIDEALNETRYYGFMLSSFAELDFGKIWTPLEGVNGVLISERNIVILVREVIMEINLLILWDMLLPNRM